jgi:hypothetical protein
MTLVVELHRVQARLEHLKHQLRRIIDEDDNPPPAA